MKKVFAILLILCMALALFACNSGSKDNQQAGGSQTSSGGDSNQPAGGGNDNQPAGGGGDNQPAGGGHVSARDTVTMAITQDRGTLDPLYMVGYDNMQGMRLIYEPLWEFDENYQDIKWVLATAIDMSDPLVWIISLRDDVYYTNGNKFTADDVLFSLYIANNRAGEPPYFLTMDNDANRKIDDYTVEIHYTEFRVGTVNSYVTIFMYNEESYDFDTIGMEPMGTGPYLMTDYVVNSHMNFERRESGYWGPLPPIKYIKFNMLQEEAQRVNALETNAVDISAVPFQDLEYVRSMPEMDVRMVPARGCRTIYCNATNPDSPFFNNVDARRAIFYAIDPQGILDVVYNGYGEVAKCPYSMNASDANPADFGKGVYGHGYDPALAREYAEKSGLIGKEIRFINNGSPDMVTIAELTQAYLHDIGIEVTIQTLDAGSWLSYRFDATSFDLCVDFTGGNPAAVDLAVWWNFAGNGAAQGDVVGMERYRELADSILTVTDQNVLYEYYAEMTDILAEFDLFYNLVDMVAAQATNKHLVVDRISYGWIDWMTAYWDA